MLILGIDPGLNTTGYGLLEYSTGKIRLVEAGVVRSLPSKKQSDLGLRLKSLFEGISEIVDQYKPEAMAIEQLYSHYAHPRTAIIMGHARGALLLAAGMKNIPVHHFKATQIKKTITGHGHASKEQIQATVTRELGLLKAPEPYDVTDALAVALCFVFSRKMTEQTSRKRAI
ncbi:crossover junction endodeoxyribonuclease RuvC [Telmatocola sphagniphila]|jgi:crossover junction endodeoxyribonuclease RuvC|uniref:Crossover junction endodeoxyribonuclease RuvC n=1 Tax=Telmatocola sphagniphila TaxID=1123043 RepID=A0A8E6B493_9BACT|nr:crossover junction endodeoxyribonuclease RuvC [Telmatocola sphagniphila]QVL31441.1 crossover junction endodeoxyribonuclease RuvC [Telmatocola sphagniphila]